MINNPPPFYGPNIKIPIRIPIKGRGLIDQWFTLLCCGIRARVSYIGLDIVQAD